jgi:hypothetical protein
VSGSKVEQSSRKITPLSKKRRLIIYAALIEFRKLRNGGLNMKKMIIAAALATGLGLSLTGASAGTLTFQDVTFTTNVTSVADGTFTLTIDNLLTGATGNWANVNYFSAFDVRDAGGAITGGTATYLGNLTVGQLGTQVSGSGADCQNGGAGALCFDLPNVQITDHMVFNIDLAGGPFTLGALDAIHLRVAFLVNQNDTTPTGSLLSQDIPGPIVGAGLPGLLMACGGLIALARRRRQQVA